jgi:hypothetical protein
MRHDGRETTRPQSRLTAACLPAFVLVLGGCSFFVGQEGRQADAERGEQQAEASREQTGEQQSRARLDVDNQVQAVMREETKAEVPPLSGMTPDHIRSCLGAPAQDFGGGGTGLSQWVYFAGGRASPESFTCKITVSFDAGKSTYAQFAAPSGQSMPNPPPECVQRARTCESQPGDQGSGSATGQNPRR